MTYLSGCALLPHPPIMLTEVGGAESEKVRQTAAAAEAAANFLMQSAPSTIVIITPHGPAFRDAVAVNMSPVLKGNLAAFNAADIAVSFETNNLLAQNILKQAERFGVSLVPVDAAMAQTHRFSLALDHGAVIPLHYAHKAGFRGQVVQLCVGFVSYSEMYALGKAVQNAVEGTRQKVSVLASGDLSHRLLPGAPAGYSPSGKVFDEKIIHCLQTMDAKALFEIDPQLVADAGECGLRPIFFLLGTLDGLEVEASVLSYEGPFGVGYAVATFRPSVRKLREG